MELKPNDRLLIKTYGLHEGWVGNIKCTYLGTIDEAHIVVLDATKKGKFRMPRTLWKVSDKDIVAVLEVT